MNAQQEISRIKACVDVELEACLNKVIQEIKTEDRYVVKVLEDVKALILSGGKRVRASMMYYGYCATGGKKTTEIIKASLSVELIHAFLLMHDDIMDRDDFRHGKPTIHSKYAKRARMFFPKKDHTLFGDSVAIAMGDMLFALGNEQLFTSRFPSDRIVLALSRLQGVVSHTIVGQIKDIRMGYANSMASEKEILKMYEQKTARYTLEGPLVVGATLGGGDDVLIRMLGEYAVPVGIAYQIQDDILGIFGSKSEVGKPVGSDIEQGKSTLLMAYAYRHADLAQRKVLDQCLGKPSTTRSLREVRSVMKETGALAYARALNTKYLEEGMEVAKRLPSKSLKAKDFLISIVAFLSERKV